MAKVRTWQCSYHCSGCGRHFHSLTAFDHHRRGDFNSDDPISGRHCESPYELVSGITGKLLLTILTEKGECTVGGFNRDGSERSGKQVTIWTTADYRSVGQRLGK